MIELILSYLVYNLIAGAVLCLYHHYMEPGSVKMPELWWLLFFPAVGLGKWKYQWSRRHGAEIDFPEKWFIYKYMKKVHWGFIIANLVAVLFMASSFLGLFDPPYESNESSDMGLFEAVLTVVAMAFIASFLLSGLVTILIALAVLSFVWFLLIYIPHYKMSSIEMETLKQRYLDERDKNSQQGLR